ncbi:MAG: cysteine desulfurase [Leptospiraceae bacterium]|nr:cysteine desulfurase [Leptospiraceae bacterium]MCP5513498.1 cysteine desulfurase [Leptospiraceae bacterium]
MNYYFDYNATTPIHHEIKVKIPEWLEEFGNPSSLHSYGRSTSRHIATSRRSILDSLGLDEYHLVFTASGSEANHLALSFLYHRKIQEKDSILISSIEHPCIEKQMDRLKSMGYKINRIPVSREGSVDLDYIKEHLDSSTILCSVMAANNETGVVQDVETISSLCAEEDVYFHCDTTQIPGKFSMDYSRIDADSYTFSAHKIYGLKGIGALAYRTKPEPMITGGLQENELRAGTENILGILGFEKAMNLVRDQTDKRLREMSKFQERIETEFKNLGIEIVGKGNRLSNTSCVLIPGRSNDETLSYFDKNGIALSKGAACHSGVWGPSPVLLSMGIPREKAETGVRISTGWFTTDEEVDALLEVTKNYLK